MFHLIDWLYKVDLSKEIQEVYLHSFLFKLGESLVSIFVPLYLLNEGFSIFTVILFYVTYYSMHIIFSLPFMHLASAIGYKTTSLLSSVFILSFYVGLRGVDVYSFLLFPVAMAGGIGFNLYWTGMNPEVAKSSDDKDRDEETGIFFSMPALASMISPFIGGVILAGLGFQFLFSLTAGLMFLSFTPFLLSREHHDGMNVNFSQLLSRRLLFDISTYMFEGAHSVAKKVLWPLYLAVIITGSVSIGIAGSLLAFGGAVTSIFVGRLIQDHGKKQVILTGSVLSGISLVVMSFVVTPMQAALISGVHGLVYTGVNLPIYSIAIERSEEIDLLEYFALREICLSIGRIISLTGLFVLFTYLDSGSAFLFGFIALGILTFLTGFSGTKVDELN